MKEAREFCLRIIREVYGYEYRPDWHADLDSLLETDGIYSSSKQGHVIVKRRNGQIVGVGGLRNLSTHSASWKRFRKRYATGKAGALWRVYVDEKARGMGIGTQIVADLEKKASELGYHYLYLHTSERNPGAVKFWSSRGFTMFARDDNDDLTVHMEKRLT